MKAKFCLLLPLHIGGKATNDKYLHFSLFMMFHAMFFISTLEKHSLNEINKWYFADLQPDGQVTTDWYSDEYI